MDIDKLQVGMIVKNYKELCSLLDEPVKDGNSKKAQLKEFERYFRYHKEGNKFVIDEIYGVVQARRTNRIELPYKEEVRAVVLSAILNSINSSKWCEHVKDDRYVTYMTNGEFSKTFSLYNNNNMSLAQTNAKSFSNTIKVDEYELRKMLNNYKSQDRHLIESSLKFLSNKHLITWYKIKRVLKRCDDGRDCWFEMTKEENIRMKEVKRELLTYYGAKDEYSLMISGKIGCFYSELKSILESELGIKDFIDVNEIFFNERIINDYFTTFGGIEVLNQVREELSSKVVNHRLQVANTKHGNNIKRLTQLNNIHNSLKRECKDILIDDVVEVSKEDLELFKELESL